jgi:hypothetical protein
MRWKDKLIDQLTQELHDDIEWNNRITKILTDSSNNIHLAIVTKPYTCLILNGQKKIESRFSINKIAPFMKVAIGDIIVLKESGGLVIGMFEAGIVTYLSNLNKESLSEVEQKYGALICTSHDKDFWKKREKAKYGSLIEVKKVKEFRPFRSDKKDRSGWALIRECNKLL